MMKRTEYFRAEEFNSWLQRNYSNEDKYQGYISSFFNNFIEPNGGGNFFRNLQQNYTNDPNTAIAYLEQWSDKASEYIQGTNKLTCTGSGNSMRAWLGVFKRYIEFLSTKRNFSTAASPKPIRSTLSTRSQPKYFTKSAFKVALECPWKLYYYRHPELYANAKAADEFMEALAEGGFQVGELAKIYCNVDVDLKDIKDNEEALQQTKDLMKRENIVIAEAAFLYNNMFVRVDILEKRGKDIKLIEVKAKSWNPDTKSFWGAKPKGSVWGKIRPYVYDVAFQKYVLENALGTDYNIKAYLMMADKTKTADINGINQMFRISKDKQGRSFAIVVEGAIEKLEGTDRVLTAFDVNDVADGIIAGTTTEQCENFWMQGLHFKEFVEKCANIYCSDVEYPRPACLGSVCFKCEFHQTEEKEDEGKLEGKAKCWENVEGYTTKPLLETMNGSSLSTNRDKWVHDGKYFMEDVVPDIKAKIDDPKTKVNESIGLHHLERKLLQIALETKKLDILDSYVDRKWINGGIYLDKDGLKAEMDTWKFPLHMIDFETTAVALPYYKRMKPYEQVAFQFSHHVIYEDGTIEHRGQYLNNDVSQFPNFEFVKELKAQLEGDEGTIFRYSSHENSILRCIAQQLQESNEPDKGELIDFIKDLTHNKYKDKGEVYTGKRDMVDLLEVVKRYYYNVDEMHGSNSIKQVLPAVLNSSAYLKNKYSKEIYGSQINSCNFDTSNAKAWITFDANGHVESPYHLLDSVGALIGMSDAEMAKMEQMQISSEENESGEDFGVANGGAALTAYNKLMFCDDNKVMDAALRTALLRYCELDTMSMVFIWEYFNHECK